MNDVVQFLTRHGYAVLFLAVLAEQVGLPIPSGVVLIAAGSLAGSGAMSLWSALGLALTASLMGDFVWFMLGKWRGRSILATLCRISLEPDTCVRQTEGLVNLSTSLKNLQKSIGLIQEAQYFPYGTNWLDIT